MGQEGGIHAQGRTLSFLSVLLYLCTLEEVSSVFCYLIESLRQGSVADIDKVSRNAGVYVYAKHQPSLSSGQMDHMFFVGICTDESLYQAKAYDTIDLELISYSPFLRGT